MEIVKIKLRKRDCLMSVDMQDGSDPVDVRISLLDANKMTQLSKGGYFFTDGVCDFQEWRKIKSDLVTPRLNQYSVPDMLAAFQAGMSYGTSQYLSTSYTEFMDNLDSSK